MAELKKKTYVLTVSSTFPSTHFRIGENTGFVEKILKGFKPHTIRGNSTFWKKRIDEINEGNAVLSLRYWSGLPYHSEQVEFLQLEKVGYEFIDLDFKTNKAVVLSPKMAEYEIDIPVIACNDGLNTADFREWFKDHDGTRKIIIHFSDLRYAN